MKWLKNLFKKQEKEEKVETKQEYIEETISSSEEKICDYCNLPIHGEQKSITKFKKHYHVKPCWRNLQKDVKRGAFQ